jgi:hypothetical protein
MKHEKHIPKSVKQLHKKLLKSDRYIRTRPIPNVGIPVVSTGNGTLKAGVKGWIIAGEERIVYLGSNYTRTSIAEFEVLFEYGGILPQQYGRDIEFVGNQN